MLNFSVPVTVISCYCMWPWNNDGHGRGHDHGHVHGHGHSHGKYMYYDLSIPGSETCVLILVVEPTDMRIIMISIVHIIRPHINVKACTYATKCNTYARILGTLLTFRPWHESMNMLALPGRRKTYDLLGKVGRETHRTGRAWRSLVTSCMQPEVILVRPDRHSRNANLWRKISFACIM